MDLSKNINTAFKQPGQLHLVYLSRIHRHKNLRFLLDLLFDIVGDINLDIFGPIRAFGLLERVPKSHNNIAQHSKSEVSRLVSPDEVISTMSKYHLFVLPTLSENYGHAILEALSAGCLVLVSDQTPWSDINSINAGWAIPLNRPEEFRIVLQQATAMSQEQFRIMSENAVELARTRLQNTADVVAMRRLFKNIGTSPYV